MSKRSFLKQQVQEAAETAQETHWRWKRANKQQAKWWRWANANSKGQGYTMKPSKKTKMSKNLAYEHLISLTKFVRHFS